MISNTLSITIAQRVREFATLRTIGGSRRQVLRTVMLEAFVVGARRLGHRPLPRAAIAKGLNALFVAIGVEFPKGDTVLATRTIVVSLLVGIIVTLLASLRPAIKATRVPPIAAVREGAALPVARLSRFGPVASLVTLALGILVLVFGIFGERPDYREPSAGSRVRDAGPLHRRLAERQACSPAARLVARLARHQDRRDCRHARPRERDAEPEQDRGDCVRADDRPGADHLRRHPGCGPPRLVRRRRRQAVRR